MSLCCIVASVDTLSSVIGGLIMRGSSWTKVVRVLGRVLCLGRNKGTCEHVELDASEVKKAKLMLSSRLKITSFYA